MKKHVLSGVLLLFTSFVYCVSYHELQKMPKVELHMHLGGSYPLEYIASIATPAEYETLKKAINQFVDGVDYTQCFFVFDLINTIINTNEKVENGVYALCKELEQDGVVYAEMRTGLKDLGSGLEEYLKAVLAGIARASSATLTVKILLSIRRTSSIAYVQKIIELALNYKDRGVVGIDVSDNSITGDITPLIPLLQYAASKGLGLVVHMGESPLEKDQMLLLEQLRPARIGHGVHLTPEALDWIRLHKTPLEVCLSSSVCARMVDSYDQHPGLLLYAQGHPVVVCTDDPLIFKTTVTREYELFARQMNLSLLQMHALIEQSHWYRLDALMARE